MSIFDEYAEIIISKYEDRVISVERFLSLLAKIDEWERMDELYGGKGS